MPSRTEGQTPHTSEGEKAEVMQALADYQTAFSAHDPQSTQLSYHKPCMVLEPERVVVLASSTEIEAFFASAMQSLEARGWQHSQWIEVSVEQLSDGVALVSTVAVRYMTDGEELERVGATYAFRKTDIGWKIAVVIPHPQDKVLYFNAPPLS